MSKVYKRLTFLILSLLLIIIFSSGTKSSSHIAGAQSTDMHLAIYSIDGVVHTLDIETGEETVIGNMLVPQELLSNAPTIQDNEVGTEGSNGQEVIHVLGDSGSLLVYTQATCEAIDCSLPYSTWIQYPNQEAIEIFNQDSNPSSDEIITPMALSSDNKIILFENSNNLWKYEIESNLFTKIEVGSTGFGKTWTANNKNVVIFTGSTNISDSSSIQYDYSNILKYLNLDTMEIDDLIVENETKDIFVHGWISKENAQKLIESFNLSNKTFGISSISSVPEATSGFQTPIVNNHYGWQWMNCTDYDNWLPDGYDNGIKNECPSRFPFHPGDDYNGAGNDCRVEVHAVANGTVKYVNTSVFGGIVIEHNWKGTTVYSQYGHVNSSRVYVGQNVNKGDHIANVSNVATSSCHLHWEIREADHPQPNNGNYYSNLTSSNVNNWYEDPEQWVSSHGPYTTGTTCESLGGEIKLYSDSNCSGSNRTYGPGFHNTSDFNDQASSVYIPMGRSIRMYEHSDRGGQSICRNQGSSMWNLGQDNWPNGSNMNNTISSIEVYNSADCQAPPSNNVIIYERSEYCDQQCTGGFGGNNCPDNAFSFEIPSGGSIWVYENDNFTGNQLCFTASYHNVQDYGMVTGFDSYYAHENHNDCPVKSPKLVSPANGSNIPDGTYITLDWDPRDNATEYRAHIWGPNDFSVVSGFSSDTHWGIGSQWPGTYYWKVQARNDSGTYSDWSGTWSFTVEDPASCGPGTANEVSIFEDANCDGNSEAITSNGVYYQLGGVNDKTSSIHVPAGKSVVIFENALLGSNGKHLCRTENSDLWDMSLDTWPDGSPMNNSISAVQAFNSPNCQPYVEVTAPTDWCSGWVSWVQDPFAIPQNPNCSFGEYVSEIDGNQVIHASFDNMKNYVAGKWTTMYFSPRCGQEYVPFNQVTIFDGLSCSGNYQNYDVGTYDVSNETLWAVHIPTSTSIAFIKNGNPGQTVCRQENLDMWNLQEDVWPDGSSMWDTVGTIKVFDTPDCGSFITSIAPTDWCQGGIGWYNEPYFSLENPQCGFGEYQTNVGETQNSYDNFQDMADYMSGQWGSMWFSPRCGEYVPFNQVTIFDSHNCLGSYQHYDFGTHDVSGNTIQSVHIPTGNSIAFIKDGNPDQTICRQETTDMWNLQEDTWPDGSSMWNTVGTIKVFDTPDCGPHVPVEAPDGWCQGYVGWFNSPSNIPQDPQCTFGIYNAKVDEIDYQFSNFQDLADFISGRSADTWFTPQCGNYVPFNQVTIFDNISCSGGYKHYSPGTYDATQSIIWSIHIPSNSSVALIKEGDFTQTTCRQENSDMWNLKEDVWPDGSSMWDTVGTIKVFDTPDCAAFIPTSAPDGWCQGYVGWFHTQQDIPQDPQCNFGDYISDINGNQVTHASFQEMVNYLDGKNGNMMFTPKCGDYVPFNQVTIFDAVSCSGDYQHYNPGTYDTTGLTIWSIHIPVNTSVLFTKNGDLTQSICRQENLDMWNLKEDIWNDGSSMWDTIGTIKVFSNSSCEQTEFNIYLPLITE